MRKYAKYARSHWLVLILFLGGIGFSVWKDYPFSILGLAGIAMIGLASLLAVR